MTRFQFAQIASLAMSAAVVLMAWVPTVTIPLT